MYYKEDLKLFHDHEAVTVICISMIDLFFTHRFILFLIGEANRISSALIISFIINSHGQIGSFPLSWSGGDDRSSNGKMPLLFSVSLSENGRHGAYGIQSAIFSSSEVILWGVVRTDAR